MNLRGAAARRGATGPCGEGGGDHRRAIPTTTRDCCRRSQEAAKKAKVADAAARKAKALELKKKGEAEMKALAGAFGIAKSLDPPDRQRIKFDKALALWPENKEIQAERDIAARKAVALVELKKKGEAEMEASDNATAVSTFLAALNQHHDNIEIAVEEAKAFETANAMLQTQGKSLIAGDDANVLHAPEQASTQLLKKPLSASWGAYHLHHTMVCFVCVLVPAVRGQMVECDAYDPIVDLAESTILGQGWDTDWGAARQYAVDNTTASATAQGLETRPHLDVSSLDTNNA